MSFLKILADSEFRVLLSRLFHIIKIDGKIMPKIFLSIFELGNIVMVSVNPCS